MPILIHIFWPTLEAETSEERSARHSANAEDCELIRRTDWSLEGDLALQEAKCLVDNEMQRRRSADEKASTYLLVTAALIPLLTYLESAIWDQKAGTAPKWLILPLLALAVSYIVGTGYWAFKTLQVRSFVTLDARDIATIWAQKAQIHSLLARAHFIVSRRNRDSVNEKVGTIMLAHRFLLRAFIVFCALILTESVCEFMHATNLILSNGKPT